ncbi:MAG: hypothetical protein FWD66_00980 [Paludibacter sp.]|nr:hypothetical protein [Paludibacter sp.]
MSREGAKGWWGIDLPKHIAYLYKPIGHETNWSEYTYKEIFAKKKAKQDYCVMKKREHTREVPGYIYVFFNSCFLFCGYYIMIITRYGEWHLNWKTRNEHKPILTKIKEKLHYGIIPELADERWYIEFCKRNPIPQKGVQKLRGKKFVKCVINSYNNLIDIIL